MQWKWQQALSILSIVALCGCATMDEPQATKVKSLYDRLGGKPVVTAVVDDFVARLAVDRRINRFFANTDMPPFKAKLVMQLCEVSGGPCKYTGKDMRTAHAGLGISEADFNALVADLVITLDKFKVPEPEKSDLLRMLGPMKQDIVTQ